jgi:hypothetical protein
MNEELLEQLREIADPAKCYRAAVEKTVKG